MTDTPNRPPLWREMDQADRNIKLSAEQKDWPRYIKAAEIRALRDWLLPEEDKPNDVFCCPPVSTMLWQQRMDLRALLTTEADRAESGDA